MIEEWLSAGAWSEMLNSQHESTVRGQLILKLQWWPASHCSLYQASTSRRLKKSHILFLFVFESHSVLHYHKMLAMMCPDAVYVVVWCGMYCGVLCFPFCWITIWCGNCHGATDNNSCEDCLRRNTFPLFLWQLYLPSFFCTILFFPPVVFTLLLCVSLRNLCS